VTPASASVAPGSVGVLDSTSHTPGVSVATPVFRKLRGVPGAALTLDGVGEVTSNVSDGVVVSTATAKPRLAQTRTSNRGEVAATGAASNGDVANVKAEPGTESTRSFPALAASYAGAACSGTTYWDRDEVDEPKTESDAMLKDLSDLQLHENHACRPLWIDEDGYIISEAFHPLSSKVSEFLIAIAEPVSRPELIQEFVITETSLRAAVSSGMDVEQIVDTLRKLCKCELDSRFVYNIISMGKSIGKLKLVLRDARHFLVATDPVLLQILVEDQVIAESLVPGSSSWSAIVEDPASLGTMFETAVPDDIAATGETGAPTDIPGEGNPDVAPTSVEVNSLRVEHVKAAAHRLHLPLLQEYEFKADRTDRTPELSIFIKPSVTHRPYQQKALSKMFAVEGVAKSGIVVLPCGAGKTLVGITAAVRIKRRTLVLTTTSVAVDQWRRQFLLYTTIAPEDIYMLTAEHKRPVDNPDTRACVMISTYTMMGYTGKRSDEGEFVLNQVRNMEWGLMVVDEVQVMPARTFRTVATAVKSHCSLGLTATLVREDTLVHDLHWLIGPKLYEASWQQLQDDGYIARVRCVEVWCDMSPTFFAEYLRAQDVKTWNVRHALWTCNPNKLKVCEYLLRFHESRGDKIIVFSDHIFILKEFAKRMGRYYISGEIDMRERMQILSAFQESPHCNTIFLSKVGDNAIDIPAANVIIQISSHFGSRRQEAQRLGRILRPKPAKSFQTHEKFNAFFYSLVSRDTHEMYYANRRQQFLVEQGYNYKVISDPGVFLDPESEKELVFGGKESELLLLKQVIESTQRGEDKEKVDDDLALQDPSAIGKSFAAANGEVKIKQELKPQAPPLRATRPGEERLSISSLSGGMDGSYTVTAKFGQKMKRADSLS